MYTPRRCLRTPSLIAAVSLAAACVSQRSSLARQPAHVDPNAPAVLRIDANTSSDTPTASRGALTHGESVRYARMEDLLAARAPGLDVRPIGNGRFTLRVRGHTALPNAEPVVVIDGMRYLKNAADMLSSIAPREVKRIEVLKDAASIAGFSGVGTGGVIVVTTWRH
jgi:TonB-dependent starch-binding outer membrane protein SusC